MKIAEVSAQYNLSIDTLRYYERIGLIPPIKRTRAGIRDYSELDLRRIEFIKCMRNAGLPIEALIDYMKLFQQGADTIDARKDILVEQRENIRAKINELQTALDLLDYKIERYETTILKRENELIEAI